jgi:anti-sigma factor RsiW
VSECRRLRAYLEAFIDGELSPERILEVEQHLLQCGTCAEWVRLQHAIQRSTREVVREAAVPSAAFRARVAAALAAERQRAGADTHPARARMLPWRSIVPLAAAAAVALLWAASLNNAEPLAGSPEQGGLTTSSVMTVEQLLDELVDYHANPPTPEVVEEALVRRFEPRVGVPVRVPSLRQFGAQWEGGSVVAIAPQRPYAASLRYSLGGHRVTVYVYDATRIPLRITLEPRLVQNVPVYVGIRRGYSIAAAERHGVGYALASDLEEKQSAQLVATSVR